MYEAVTDGIKVSVTPYFLEDQSSPVENHYVWAYQISIENLGEETVRLLNRFWRITNANGQIEELECPGVVGEQPVLEPGDFRSPLPSGRSPLQKQKSPTTTVRFRSFCSILVALLFASFLFSSIVLLFS